MNRKLIIAFLLALLLTSCGAYFNQPVGVQKAVFGENTPATITLRSLPLPKEQVVVGVYKFKDQTGQYKPTEIGSTFSTAVTQGATSILIKALQDSKWFVPIERENLSNLLNERNIIRSTRQEYATDSNTKDTPLTPLLFAGVLLEGGIISYDSNIITGGYGARYFGAGASTQYRQDRISIYLRLVSTSNGKILNTVYVSKTILSQSIDASLFRYVNINRLLEVETGYTRNEPIQLAVTEAIEKAVEGLVVDGIKDKIWEVKATNDEVKAFLDNYAKEKEEADLALLYGRDRNEKRGKAGFDLAGGAAYIDGDYINPTPKPMFKAGMRYFFTPYFDISGSFSVFRVGNKDMLDVGYGSIDVNLDFTILPYDYFSPFVYIGTGTYFNKAYDNIQNKIQGGVGLEYLVSNNFGIKVYSEFNMSFSDRLDYIAAGKRDDYFYCFGLGVSYYIPQRFGKKAVK
ncbi:CsgG/HfaB family protein [Flavobacterium granuli]|uniref:Curli production assembly/transport component CsgG n=1 Tax=Flavobacterium granuli TaxID=280093 RepID=A0ABU1RY60_9FLAO|nr:CsgG/HfaB family protein [Flavobacterium granuli]MDR6843697.1 curli production assembly/transport component CsgG [Flavobacterium granuli]